LEKPVKANGKEAVASALLPLKKRPSRREASLRWHLARPKLPGVYLIETATRTRDGRKGKIRVRPNRPERLPKQSQTYSRRDV
jgi:hypothetical protein